MSWFKSNKVEARIANILKGTSNPASSIGDNGQLYLKYYDYSNDYSFREYLEATSSGPYINTEVACTSNAYFEVDFNFTGSHSESRVFGCGHGGGAMFLIQNYNIDYMSVGVSSVSDTYQIPDANNRHKYKANADGIYVDDVLVDTNVHWDNALPQRHYNLFAIDWDGTAYYATNARVYSCRIWNGTQVIRYFVPAMRKSDDAIGMFDIVNGIFYTNSGSGSFTISSTEINIGNTIIDSFAKVDNAWQNLIGTNIDDILAGGSKYIKATGSFTSASSGGQKVEVNCGFKPDLVMVDMEFGNGFTRATYLSTAWYEETDHPASVWDLRPMENTIYAIVPGSVSGETGITDLTDTGFKYRSNGSNTTNKACTYTAIKFDVEEAPAPVVPFEKEILHSIVQDQSGSSVPVSVTFTEDYQIAFICGLIADNVGTGAVSVNAFGGASELYGEYWERYVSAGIAVQLPSNKTLTGYFPYSDGGAYYDIFGAIGMSRLPSEYEVGATIDVSNISIELSKVYDHIVVFVGMNSNDSNSITLAMNGASIPLTVESEKFSRYSYHASEELTINSATLNFTYSGGTVNDNTIVVFAYNE